MKVIGLALLLTLISGFAVADVEVYTIQEEDTLEKVAEEKYGDALLWFQLAKYNNISDPDLIKAGQKILILPEAELLTKINEWENLEARIGKLEKQLSRVLGSALEPLFEDNFEDDELGEKPEGWLFPSGGKWRISSFESRILEQTNRRAPNSAALVGEKEWSDYIAQVELRIAHSGETGVFAYWSTHHENYRLRTASRRTELEIAKRVPKGAKQYNTITLSKIPFRLEDGIWYIFKFEVTTHDSYTYLRGKVWQKGETEPGTWLLEASDHSSSSYGNGLAGVWTISIGTSYRDARFDNLKVFEVR